MDYPDTLLAPLIVAWWKGGLWLLLSCAAAALLRARKFSAGQRRLFWAGVVAGLLLLSAFQFAGSIPRWRVAAPEFAAELTFLQEVPDAGEERSGVAEPESDPRVPASAPPRVAGRSSVPASAGWPLSRLAVLLWASGSFLLALRLLRGQWQLRRAWRRAKPADGAWREALATAAGELSLRHARIEIRQSGEIRSPMVWGVFRSRILLPTGLRNHRRLVLLHELQHVAQRDPSLNLLAQAALFVHWPNPLAWLAAGWLRSSQEQACDDRVRDHSLSRDPDGAEAYADALLALARHPSATSGHHAPAPLALSMTSRPSALRKRITAILDHSMKHAPPRKRESLPVFALQSAFALALAVLAFGEPVSAQVKRETEALKKRVAELEGELGKLKEASAESIAAAELEEIREENKAKARERMREDLEEYTREELRAIEELYQVANKNWRSPEAKASLEKLVKKYKKANRTGCALLYLAQYSEGAEREAYLRRVVQRFSDCYYGNGCQVGGYARYLLAAYLVETGEDEEAADVIEEIRKDYDTATSHKGTLIVDYLEKLE